MRRILAIAVLSLVGLTVGYRSSEAQLDPAFGTGEDGDGTGGIRSRPSGGQGGMCGHIVSWPMCADCERWPYHEKCIWVCDGAFECRWLIGGTCYISPRERFCRSSMFH